MLSINHFPKYLAISLETRSCEYECCCLSIQCDRVERLPKLKYGKDNSCGA